MQIMDVGTKHTEGQAEAFQKGDAHGQNPVDANNL